MKQFLFDLAGFFLPVYCPVCGSPLHLPGQVICLSCESGMPYTGSSRVHDNPVALIFRGRVRIEEACSLIRFEKGSAYQALFHQLKYAGEKRIGLFLGQLLGAELTNTPYAEANYIIPVPLHRKKQKKRGFNQCDLIAAGVSALLEIPVLNSVVERRTPTGSQTKKRRYERWQNMEDVFVLVPGAEAFAESVFLLIDDVVTTGATLESCARVLLALPGARVYIATIACA